MDPSATSADTQGTVSTVPTKAEYRNKVLQAHVQVMNEMSSDELVIELTRMMDFAELKQSTIDEDESENLNDWYYKETEKVINNHRAAANQ